MSKQPLVLTTYDFYDNVPSKLLLKIRLGFERDHDAVCSGDDQRQPVDWLRDRISIINRIIELREFEAQYKPGGQPWAKVESGQAQTVKRWNVIRN